jgi:hypothetical protein
MKCLKPFFDVDNSEVKTHLLTITRYIWIFISIGRVRIMIWSWPLNVHANPVSKQV